MNRVIRRSWIMVLFLLILVGGTGFFVGEYFLKSDSWVVSAGSPHVYNSTNIGCGRVQDREGIMLLDIIDGRTYSDSLSVRQSTLHWVGDRKGNISAPAISHYAKEMSGFDTLNGVYAYGGVGGDATLTLSSRVQTAALEALNGRKGTVAVYNYKTGELLCAVTSPTFDPDNAPDLENEWNSTYDGIYLNRFLQSSYVPGSIFKIVTTAAALETIPDIQQQKFTCTGTYAYGVDRVTCEAAHGTNDLKNAFARSCNCAFAQIADQLGKDVMSDYVEKFGLLDSVSFDGITTAKGNYDVTDAAAVELAWSCIGQYTDLINPCVYLNFVGAIANGGREVYPHVVGRIQVGEEITYEAEPAEGRQIMSPEAAQTLREFMGHNVAAIYGDWNFPGLNVCAKSGTSQLGGGQTSNAMFAGFVEDEAYPLAFIVVIENGGYGSTACVPVLSRVLGECKAVMDLE